MSLEEKRITIKFFFCVIGGLAACWVFLWGWNWVRVDNVEARQQSVESVNAQINAQLSQIQTDLKWLIEAQKK